LETALSQGFQKLIFTFNVFVCFGFARVEEFSGAFHG
jgi:hypothetical protein